MLIQPRQRQELKFKRKRNGQRMLPLTVSLNNLIQFQCVMDSKTHSFGSLCSSHKHCVFK